MCYFCNIITILWWHNHTSLMHKLQIFSIIGFLGSSRTFQIIRKLSRPSRNFQGNPETFQAIRKLSGLSRKYLDYPETFQTIRKLSWTSGNFPDGLETSQCNFKGYAQKLSGRAKTFQMAMPRCHDGFCASELHLIKQSSLVYRSMII